MAGPDEEFHRRAASSFRIILEKAVGSTEETEAHGSQYIPRIRGCSRLVSGVRFTSISFLVLQFLPWIFNCVFSGLNLRIAIPTLAALFIDSFSAIHARDTVVVFHSNSAIAAFLATPPVCFFISVRLSPNDSSPPHFIFITGRYWGRPRNIVPRAFRYEGTARRAPADGRSCWRVEGLCSCEIGDTETQFVVVLLSERERNRRLWASEAH